MPGSRVLVLDVKRIGFLWLRSCSALGNASKPVSCASLFARNWCQSVCLMALLVVSVNICCVRQVLEEGRALACNLMDTVLCIWISAWMKARKHFCCYIVCVCLCPILCDRDNTSGYVCAHIHTLPTGWIVKYGFEDLLFPYYHYNPCDTTAKHFINAQSIPTLYPVSLSCSTTCRATRAQNATSNALGSFNGAASVALERSILTVNDKFMLVSSSIDSDTQFLFVCPSGT